MTSRELFAYVRLKPARRGKTTTRSGQRTPEEDLAVAKMVAEDPGAYHPELLRWVGEVYEARRSARRAQLANEQEHGQ